MSISYTKKELKEIINSEGAEYALMDYVNPVTVQESNETPKLKELWANARYHLGKLLDYLKPYDEEEEE